MSYPTFEEQKNTVDYYNQLGSPIHSPFFNTSCDKYESGKCVQIESECAFRDFLFTGTIDHTPDGRITSCSNYMDKEMKNYNLMQCGEFLYRLERTIEYDEETRKLDSEFLSINELIEELEFLKEQCGGDEIIHLLDVDEANSQLSDVSYVPLGIVHSSLVKHVDNVKAGLIISRTKDYYRDVKEFHSK